MKKKSKKREKLNNKGFSIVEVITAVVILGIVAIPVLNSFITSLRVSEKSKQLQRVTAAAESIMEGFKAYKYDELVDQFDGTSAFHIYNDTALTAYSCDTPDTNPALTVATTNSKGVATTVDTAQFYMKGLNYQGTLYDAKISLLPYESATGVSHNGTKAYLSFERMNGYKDGVYKQSLESVNTSYYAILNDIAYQLNTLDKIYGYIGEDSTRGYKPENLDMNKIKFYRETIVTMSDKQVDVSVKYTAETNSYPYYDINGNVRLLNYTSSPVSIDQTVYNTTAIGEAGAELDNLFLFVFPVYKTTESGYKFEEDKYDISYSGSRDVNVYFIKQLNSTIPNDKLITCENLYPITGRIKDVNLFHNVDVNLGDPTMHTGTTTPFTMLGSATTTGELAFETDDVMLYKVEVSIYEDGAYDSGFSGTPIYTLEGTVSE